jgi:hypothetical protein
MLPIGVLNPSEGPPALQNQGHPAEDGHGPDHFRFGRRPLNFKTAKRTLHLDIHRKRRMRTFLKMQDPDQELYVKKFLLVLMIDMSTNGHYDLSHKMVKNIQ